MGVFLGLDLIAKKKSIEKIPNPKSQIKMLGIWNSGFGIWDFPDVYFDSGSGRIWKFTSLLVFPLPPSAWNGARVE